MSNKDVVITFFTKIGENDIESLTGLMHDDLTWWTAGGDLFANAGIRDKAGVLQIFDMVKSVFPNGMVMKFGDFLEQGDKVAFESLGYSVDTTGRMYNNTYHWQITLRDGKIFEVREHLDTLYAQKTLMDRADVDPPHDWEPENYGK